MSYRCGLFGAPPYIFCDGEDCRAYIVIDGFPPAWFLDNKAKRGWRLVRRENPDGSLYRRDYCPAHHPATPAPGTGEESTVLLTPSLAADILRAEEVCHDEGIGPTGDEWKALVERARTTIAPGKREGT